MDIFPLEIWKLIFDELKCNEQIRLRSTCKYFYDNLQITVLDVISCTSNKENIYYHYFDSEMLSKFQHLIKLSVFSHKGKLDISNLTKLQTLDIQYCDDIEKINLTNLTELDITGNRQINKLKHLTKLNKLITGEDNYIIPNEITNLTNLTHLELKDNDLIYDLNMFTNLKILRIDSCSMIYNYTISELTKLVELDMSFNGNIIQLDHCKNLTKLIANSCDLNDDDWEGCNLDNECISGLTNLIELDIVCSNNITNLDTLTNLQKLDVTGCKIKDLNCLVNLKELRAVQTHGNNTKINNSAISKLTNLESLDIDNNNEIYDVSFAKKLKTLNIGHGCKVNNDGISGLINLTDLNITKNTLINDINYIRHFTNLTTLNDRDIKDFI